MATLEEQFALLMANAQFGPSSEVPSVLRQSPPERTPRTRTVYSVGEAINQRGQNAKLGAGSHRDTGTRR